LSDIDIASGKADVRIETRKGKEALERLQDALDDAI
jgi:hypothetical protein